jgi:sulfate adenylyltransferase subunit 2
MPSLDTRLRVKLPPHLAHRIGVQALRSALQMHPGRVAVVSSFGADSSGLLAVVASIDPATPVLFLDTGKHFPETLAYRDTLSAHLGLTDVRTIAPDPQALARRDPDSTLHQFIPDDCCDLRKVGPLEAALAPFSVWVTGRRRSQADTRAAIDIAEHEDGRQKLNPLADWGEADIADLQQSLALPAHPLRHAGYRSIGCAPCTRAVAPGEDARAGRWPGFSKTECGIHRPVAVHTDDEIETMTDLDQLESQSIYVLREAYRRLKPLGLLWSLGKDSNVMVWLARKAFLGRVPFPVLHVDTERKFPEMYDFRTEYAQKWNLDLRVGLCPSVEEIDPTLPPAARSAARKTAGLAAMIEQNGYAGVIAGIRRDEQATRAKERVFSPRGASHKWDVRNQPPEFWDQFATPVEPGAHVRVHPLLAWREIDIWRYIEREGIPVVDLYFARDGFRYRSLGDQDITAPIASNATTLPAIIAELAASQAPERAGRAMDHESEDAFERLRVAGYL